ncbi:adenylate/guanylate cyclase domain-containing protein [Nisaea sp.]|uniref:adenylate/guanylate cyclase domain-containing protein n=1 Tax=Nisaea sp. TaxID=2024842 RepID=UPI003296C6D2
MSNEHGFWLRVLGYNRTTVQKLMLAAFLLGGMLGGLVGRFDWGNGFLFDLAVAANSGGRPETETHTAIIAIDADSLSSDLLSTTPRTLMQPVFAKTLSALLAADAKGIAIDVLLSYSGNRWLPDHDRPLIRALYQGRGKVVLGRSSNSLPAAPFVAALGYEDNSLGTMELVPSPDGIFRHVGAGIRLESGESIPSLISAALANAGLKMPADVILGDGWAAARIPVYRLSNLLACHQTAPEILKDAFKNRIVMIGSWLDEEDRKRSSSRFVRSPSQPAQPTSTSGNCILHPIVAPLSSGSMPGVLLHALAAEAVLADSLVRTIDWKYLALLAAIATVFGTYAGMSLSPGYSIPLVIGSALLIWGLSSLLLAELIWLPPAALMIGALSGTLLVFPVRFLNERVRRQSIHRAFRQYLAPEMVERIIRDPSQLHLGGELRELTVLFCDMRGFTAFSERMADRPEEVVQILNRLLTVLTEPVLRHGGTVDKYMGDAVMAFWNAPISDPDHAEHAVAAALDMLAAVRNLNEEHFSGQSDMEGQGVRVGIGVHTGTAIVGNMGSDQRFDYTAIGDTVNLASRLEAQCKVFGSDLIVSSDTIGKTSGLAALELDEVSVSGRRTAINIFAVLGDRRYADTAEFTSLRERHSQFLKLCRSGASLEAKRLGRELARENVSLGQFYQSRIGGMEPTVVG